MRKVSTTVSGFSESSCSPLQQLLRQHGQSGGLFRDPPDVARTELAKVRALIEDCEYFRRLPELEDAEAALAGDAR